MKTCIIKQTIPQYMIQVEAIIMYVSNILYTILKIYRLFIFPILFINI